MKKASIGRRWWWLWWCFTIASNLAASLGDGTTSRLAVVVPHMQKEMKDIIHTFTSKDVRICKGNERGIFSNFVVDLVLYSTKRTFDPNRVREEFGEAAGCFRNIVTMLCPLSDTHDQYIHAPPLMWYELIRGRDSSSVVSKFMRENYDYMFLMESDVTPVRSRWVEGLVDTIRAATYSQHPDAQWWVMGNTGFHTVGGPSNPEDAYAPSRVHINGNAVYRLGDSAFESYVENVFNRFMFGTNFQAVCCYDAALFEYLMEKRERIALHMHRFRFSNFIWNIQKHWVRDVEYRNAYLTGNFPVSVYFIHGKIDQLHDLSEEEIRALNAVSVDAFEVGKGLRIDHNLRYGEYLERENRTEWLELEFQVDGVYYVSTIGPDLSASDYAKGICASDVFGQNRSDAKKKECYDAFKQRVEFERGKATISSSKQK